MDIIYRHDEIEKISGKILSLVQGYTIIAFSGDLGSGKTTLINAMCKKLGVKEIVNSPTYPIIQEYAAQGNRTIYHMDLYRINNYEEAIEAGIEDCLLSGELCLVEWPEKAMTIFPAATVRVTLYVLSPEKRKLVVQLPQ